MRATLLCLILLLIACIVVQETQTSPVRVRSRAVSKLERLNRILEKRQKHEYEADRSYKYLIERDYKVWPTKVIAGHFRQLRQLMRTFAENEIAQKFEAERQRMDEFVNDVDELNRLTDNRLYYSLGTVKESRWDDLIRFILSEIQRCRYE